MNNNVHSALSGTQTQKNLTDALSAEARSFARYRIFAQTALENGNPVLSGILSGISDNELQHAELWMNYLGENGTDIQNLEALLASEEYESGVMYPEFSETAKNEGFSEIAEKLKYAENAEKGHIELLSGYLDALKNGTLYTDDDEDTIWLCTNCGYLHTGKSAPERCPLCSYPQAYFVKED